MKEEGLKIQILLDPSYSKKNFSPNLRLTKSYRGLQRWSGVSNEGGEEATLARHSVEEGEGISGRAARF